MILEPKFGGVITFVKKAEAKLSNKLDFAISEGHIMHLFEMTVSYMLNFVLD